MQSFMSHSPATAVLDYGGDFSMLLIGLVSVVWLSAALILWFAIQHYKSRMHQPLEIPSLDTDQQADQQDAA